MGVAPHRESKLPIMLPNSDRPRSAFVCRHTRVTETMCIHAYTDTQVSRQAGRQASEWATHTNHSDRVDGPLSRKGDKSTVPFKVRDCPGLSTCTEPSSNTHRRLRKIPDARVSTRVSFPTMWPKKRPNRAHTFIIGNTKDSGKGLGRRERHRRRRRHRREVGPLMAAGMTK